MPALRVRRPAPTRQVHRLFIVNQDAEVRRSDLSVTNGRTQMCSLPGSVLLRRKLSESGLETAQTLLQTSSDPGSCLASNIVCSAAWSDVNQPRRRSVRCSSYVCRSGPRPSIIAFQRAVSCVDGRPIASGSWCASVCVACRSRRRPMELPGHPLRTRLPGDGTAAGHAPGR